MMIKRMGKHPVYWILLFLFPIAFFGVPQLNGRVWEEQIPVGYVMEESEAAEKGKEQDRENRELLDRIEEKLLEETLSGGETGSASRDIFRYIRYTKTEEMKEDILTGELSCGVCFEEGFTDKIRMRDYYHCITLYLPEGMNVGGMVREDLFRRVYQAYSAVWFAGLLGEQGYQIDSEEVLRTFSEYQKEGKVFAVNYEFQTENRGTFQNNPEGQEETAMLSLRGILAFLTLLSALLGALEGGRDRRRKLGEGIRCPGRLAMAVVGTPVLFAVLFLALGMTIHYVTSVSGMEGEIAGVTQASFGKGALGGVCLAEFGSAILYGLVLWLYGLIINRRVPVKILEGAAPCILLIVLLCCPILFHLGESIPLIEYISKLFPITWYLEFWA